MKKDKIKISNEIYLKPPTNELIFAKDEQQKKVKIEPIMVKLISLIASKPNDLFPRQELISLVWDGNDRVGDKALTKNIYKIRKVFKQNGAINPIETIPKKGYQWKMDLTEQRHSLSPQKRAVLLIGIIIIGIITLKTLFPWLFHFFWHRISH